jgi:hypothetical protein
MSPQLKLVIDRWALAPQTLRQMARDLRRRATPWRTSDGSPIATRSSTRPMRLTASSIDGVVLEALHGG